MGMAGFGLSGAGRARGGASWAAAFLLVLGLTVAGFGAAALARLPWAQAALYLSARGWPVAEATVLDLALQEQPAAGGGWRLVLSARYAYEAAGVRYEGRRVSLADDGQGSDRRLKALYSRLHFARVTGRTVPVHYDPAAPDRAHLDGVLPWRRLAADAGLGLLLVLAGGVFLRNGVRSQRAAADPDWAVESGDAAARAAAVFAMPPAMRRTAEPE